MFAVKAKVKVEGAVAAAAALLSRATRALIFYVVVFGHLVQKRHCNPERMTWQPRARHGS